MYGGVLIEDLCLTEIEVEISILFNVFKYRDVLKGILNPTKNVMYGDPVVFLWSYRDYQLSTLLIKRSR
jgi:hypothetical protein